MAHPDRFTDRTEAGRALAQHVAQYLQHAGYGGRPLIAALPAGPTFRSAHAYGRLGGVPPPPPVRRVRFDVRPWSDGSDPARELLPHVDNVNLVDLVSGYERAAGFDVPGAYAGVVLDHFKFGDLAA